MKSAMKKLWEYLGGINGLVLTAYFVFVFSSSVIAGRHFSALYFVAATVIITVISVFVCPAILRFFSEKTVRRFVCIDKGVKTRLIQKAVFYIIPLCFLLFYYFAYYPGGFSRDSLDQFSQTVSNQYNDWHPVIHTLLAFKLPLILTGNWIGAIVLLQVLVFSAVLGYSFETVYRYSNTKYAVISMVFLLINPQLGMIAMFPWKDTAFAVGALLLFTYCFKIYVTKGVWLKSKPNITLFIITAALTTLFRHNAVLFTVPLIIAVLFFTANRKTLKQCVVICAGVAVLCLGIKIPLYSALGVAKPDKRQVETLGLPMNVIGAVVTYAPEVLDEETKEFAYKVAPIEAWEEKYSYGFYNALKFDARTNNDYIEEYGALKVISMMIKCFKAAPRVSLKSVVLLTQPVYSVTDDYDGFLGVGIDENEYGISQNGNKYAAAVCEIQRNFVNQFLSYPFLHLGFWHLVLIIAVLSKLRIRKIRDWKKILFALPVFAYDFGTALLLTNAEDSTRFFFYTYTLIPMFLLFLFGENDGDEMNQNALPAANVQTNNA